MPGPLDASIVCLLGPADAPVGMGFVAGERAIVTCAHVVSDALASPRDAPVEPGSAVRLRFPLLPGQPTIEARVAMFSPGDGADAAGLLIEGDFPGDGHPTRLVRIGDVWQHSFRAFGLPADRPHGVWVSGRLLGHDGRGRLQIEGDLARDHQVSGGFSGTPLWDDDLLGAPGMIVSGISESRTSYAMTADALLAVWPDLERYARPANPYRGIDAFGEGDATVFHGRDEDVDDVLDQLRAQRILPVTGDSGVGKSSLLFAGVVPRLRARGAAVAFLRPVGRDTAAQMWARALLPLLNPDLDQDQHVARMGELADALTAPGALEEAIDQAGRAGGASELVLIADQAEALLNIDSEQLAALLGGLGRLAARTGFPVVRVLLAVRLDLLSRLEQQAAPHGCWRRPYVVPAMHESQMRQIITGPLGRGGAVKFEDGLPERMLRDAGRGPQALPLLEFALTVLWDRERRGVLSHEEYEAIGGVGGALARYADQVWDERLDDEQRVLAKQVVLRLIRVGEGGAVYRRPTALADLAPEQAETARWLAGTRIFTIAGEAGDPAATATVDLAHEALAERWDRLREWIADDTAFLVWRDRLRDEIDRWRAHGRQPRYLLGRDDLAAARDWLARRPQDMSDAEGRFVEVSANRRLRTRLRNLTITATVLALVATALTVGAFGIHRALMESRQRASQTAANYVIKNLTTLSPDTAALLAVASYRAAPTTQAQQALFDAAAGLSPYSRIFDEYGNDAGADLSTDASAQVVAVDTPAGMDLYTSGMSSSPRSAPTWHLDGVKNVRVAPDGGRLAALTTTGHLQIWDVHTQRLLFTALGQAQGVPVWSPDSRLLAYTADTLNIRVLSTVTGLVSTMKIPDQAYGGYGALGFGAVSRDLYAVDGGATLFSWDPESGALLGAPKGSQNPQIVSGDGDIAATCAGAAHNQHWQLTDPASGAALPGASTAVACDSNTEPLWYTGSVLVESEAAVNPQPAAVAAFSAGLAGIGSVVDLRTGHVRATFSRGAWTTADHITGASSTADRIVVTTKRFAAYARVAPTGSLASDPESSDSSVQQRISPDGRYLVSDTDGGSRIQSGPWPAVNVTDATTGKLLHTLPLGTEAGVPDVTVDYLFGFQFADDGTLVTEAGSIFERWDVATGERIGAAVRVPVATGTAGLDFEVLPGTGPTRIALVGRTGNRIEVWNLATSRETATIGPVAGIIAQARFSPDGTHVAVLDANGAIQVGQYAEDGLRSVLAAPGGDATGAYLIVLDDGGTAVSAGTLRIAPGSGGALDLSAPPGTRFDQIGADTSGERLVISMTYTDDYLDNPTGIAFELPASPDQWASAVCATVPRALTQDELASTGTSINDSCG